jgi:phosphoserine phosphatase RsbU/P
MLEYFKKKATILVVDDSETVRVLIDSYLRDGGYRVVEAEDGKAGLDICTTQSIDLVVLDIAMPVMDGFSLCARLQNSPQLQSIPVIMLSARDDVESKMRAFELGAVDYIIKPVGKRELLARIQTHLTISGLTTSLQEVNLELLVQQKKLLQGLHVAADLQKHLLPKRVPDCNSLRFSSYFKPCHEVGGDIYNIQRLDDEHLAIYILDVSGHGFPAAMMTVLATQVLSGGAAVTKKQRSDGRVESVTSPAEVIWKLNREFPIDKFSCYITIVYLLFNTKNHSFRYCCAGHPPLVHLTQNGALTLLSTGGPPVGMDGTWEEGEGQLSDGDRLFFYTDGFTEYSNEAGEFYGQQRLLDTIVTGCDLSLQAATQNIVGELKQFGNQIAGDDDMTLLAVEKK